MNIPLVIFGLILMISGIIGKPSEPISAPANNASIVFMIGVALILVGAYG